MRILQILLLTFLWSTTIVSAADIIFSEPESVYYEANEDAYFVSSINGESTGWISKLDASGAVIAAKWADGLQRPMGMRAFGNRLWVNNLDEIVGIAFDNPADRITYKIEDARILNDLATDALGNAYLSDSMNNRIVKVNLATGANSTWYDTSPSSPNGLLVDGDRLYVASWGVMSEDPEEQARWITSVPGSLYWLSLQEPSKGKQVVASELGNLDGVEIDEAGNIFVSDWMSGKLYAIAPGVDVAKLVHTFSQGLADIALNPKTRTIVAPLMLRNELEFFSY